MSQGNMNGIPIPVPKAQGGTGKNSTLEFINNTKVTRIAGGVSGTSGTFTPDPNCVFAIIELLGGGGGSGGTTGTAGQASCSHGGGGGGYLKIIATKAQLTAGTNNYAVGGQGAGGASGVNTGGNGGNTTFQINGGTTWVAGGGTGGLGQAASASAQQSPGVGNGGVVTVGTNATTLYAGNGSQAGYGSTVASAGIVGRIGSAGGACVVCPPQMAFNNGGATYGGGANGYQNQTGSNQAGVAGNTGLMTITEFLSSGT